MNDVNNKSHMRLLQLQGSDLSILTDRELEVLKLVGLGLSSREIADKLERSIRTIHTHRTSLGRKLNVSNRVELARIAIHFGLVNNSISNEEIYSSSSQSRVQNRDISYLNVLRMIDQRIGCQSGVDFLNSCVSNLVDILPVKCAYIGELDSTGQFIISRAACIQSGSVKGIRHELNCVLKDTLVNRSNLYTCSSASDLFPKTDSFASLNISSYLAAPLYDSKNNLIGLLALADDKPIDSQHSAEFLLTFLANRASAELQRVCNKNSYQESRELIELKKVISALEAKESVFQTVIEGATDGVVVCDEDGDLLIVNSQINEIFGYQGDELLGKSIDMLVPPRFRDEHKKQRNAYMSNPHTRLMGIGLSIMGLHKDQSEMPVEISLSPIQSKHGWRVLCMIRESYIDRTADSAVEMTDSVIEIV